MTAVGEVLRDEIRRAGPVTFHHFMETALYHPEYGYYRRSRDPFGRGGDFFTAEQLQPVFGILVAARIRGLLAGMGEGLQVVELGAGRREMAPAFAGWNYIPVDVDDGKLPEQVRGAFFSNEFFDALPVHAATLAAGVFRELRVGWQPDAFSWMTGEAVSPEIEHYLQTYFPDAADGGRFEINLDALRWIKKIAGSLQSGFVLTIDYGYTRRESMRFPEGTLMSYRRHMASDEVLAEPGDRDITAHVAFSALERTAEPRVSRSSVSNDEFDAAARR